jgi:Phytanoyl-CoA dioxygenase (PhyH)
MRFPFAQHCSTNLHLRTGWLCGIRIRRCRCVSAWTCPVGEPWSVKEGVFCAHAPAAALDQIVAIRIHLDDSKQDNGPLRVLPGSHKNGVLSDDVMHDLARTADSVECHIQSVGGVVMKPLIVHSSSKGAIPSRSQTSAAHRICLGRDAPWRPAAGNLLISPRKRRSRR